MYRLLVPLAVSFVFSACATHLPPVFNAAQLKAAAKNGHSYRFRVQAGDTSRVEVLEFDAGDACRFRVRIAAAPGGAEEVECTFEELAKHGAFPKKLTTTEEGRITVPAGTFDCVQLVRERLETGEVKRFWFADGVGKVKHHTLQTGAVEELAEYSIP